MAEGTTGLPTDAVGLEQLGLFDETNFFHPRRDTNSKGMIVAIVRREGSQTLTIASGATTSDALDMQGFSEAALALPSAAFTGTSISFTVASTSGGTYKS